MKLLVQPDAGIAPLVVAVNRARESVDIAIFRFDFPELERALAQAATRGVVVRALIAHTSSGGEKGLRKLELRLLESGVIVARTSDDLVRYHGKYLIVDQNTLYVLGFNYTHLDTSKSRSFGIETTDSKLVAEAVKLFESDITKQPFTAAQALVISPDNARDRLTVFIKRARKQLLIYDPNLTDNMMIRLLQERARAGVQIKVLGRVEKSVGGVQAEKLAKLRLHVRAMIRDGRSAFVGSQSLKRLELDRRREVGIITRHPKVVKQLLVTFKQDWLKSSPKKEAKFKPAEQIEAAHDSKQSFGRAGATNG